MSEENQEKTLSELPVRKTVITKSIRRIYNVGAYESLEINVSHQQEIEWKTPQEREKKSENICKLLIADFEKSRGQVFAALAEDENNAKLTISGGKNNTDESATDEIGDK